MSISPGTGVTLRLRGVVLLAVAGVTLGMDQISKHWVKQWVGPDPPRMVIPGVLYFSPSINYGGAFGLLPSVPWLFVGIAMGAMGAAFFYRRQILRAEGRIRTAIALLLGGTLGNLLDRLRFGYVQDFISVKTEALIGFDWPTFNVADIAITVGTLLFVSYLVHLEFQERARKAGLEDR